VLLQSGDRIDQPDFQEELAFWDRELSLTGEFAEGIRLRLDPMQMHVNYPVEILTYLDGLRTKFDETLRVLDVGSGPLSMLAHGARTGMYDLVCSDPLADAYLGLHKKHGHQPPWPLTRCFGESLTETFPRNSFHLIWSNNALDHSQHPDLVIRNMGEVLKPGGIAVIQAWENEGSSARWGGLHQHDLSLGADGHLYCRTKVPGGEITQPRCISCQPQLVLLESSFEIKNGRHYNRAVLGKR
jgi:SAM-dependent methyltransferase